MGAIQLHMPSKHAAAARRAPTKMVARAEPLAAPEPPRKPEAKPKAEPKKPTAKAPSKAVAAASPPASYNPGFGNFDQGAAGFLGNMQTPPAAQAGPPPSTAGQLARANPPPASARRQSQSKTPSPACPNAA